MSRRTTLIQMLIPCVAVALGLLAAAIDGGAGPLPAQTVEAEALALVDVGDRLVPCRRRGPGRTDRPAVAAATH